MAAKFGVPVCPHAGGVGLCEYVQHLSIFDYVAVSGCLENRVCEYVDHLHEHFVEPVRIVNGRYWRPTQPGYSIEMKSGLARRVRVPRGPLGTGDHRRGSHGRADSHRPRPLGDLRAAVLRDHHQLHRPPDHRHPQADAGGPVRLAGRARSTRPSSSSFQLAYAIGLLLAGRDHGQAGHPPRPRAGGAAVERGRHGARRGRICSRGCALPTINLDAATGLSVVLLGGAAAGFALMRFLLGLAEAGNFPAAIKTVAEWFPKKERAFATGIFNSGTNVGALLTPLAVPWITLNWGWEWAFIADRRHRLRLARVLAAHATARPRSTRGCPPPSWPTSAAIRRRRSRRSRWASLVPHRQTWAFAIGKFMTDPIWWLYLFWIPDFLNRNHGLDLKSIGLPLVVIYLVADVGSDRRRLAVVRADQARLEREPGAQDGHADLRAGGGAHRVRLAHLEPVGGGRAGLGRGGRAPGLVGQPVHAGLRHLPAAGGRLRGRASAAWRAPWAAC